MDKQKQDLISQQDRGAVLHPFTQLKDFASGKAGDPTIIETAKGITITDATGREYIDGFAGLYCMNVGYGRTEVAEAISSKPTSWRTTTPMLRTPRKSSLACLTAW